MTGPNPPGSSTRDDGDPPEASAGDESIVLGASLAHAEIQLQAQITDETSLDGRTMGVLGFNGALLAADVAAKTLLGTWWWSPLPFVGVATALCLRSTFSKDTYLGPEALTFYAAYGGQAAGQARKQLLADLDVAFKANSRRAREKAIVLRCALGILTSGLVIAALLIALDRPSKVGTHVYCAKVPTTAASVVCARPAEAGSSPGSIRATTGGTAGHH
jgi:hypothetical protein